MNAQFLIPDRTYTAHYMVQCFSCEPHMGNGNELVQMIQEDAKDLLEELEAENEIS